MSLLVATAERAWGPKNLEQAKGLCRGWVDLGAKGVHGREEVVGRGGVARGTPGLGAFGPEATADGADVEMVAGKPLVWTCAVSFDTRIGDEMGRAGQRWDVKAMARPGRREWAARSSWVG